MRERKERQKIRRMRGEGRGGEERREKKG